MSPCQISRATALSLEPSTRINTSVKQTLEAIQLKLNSMVNDADLDLRELMAIHDHMCAAIGGDVPASPSAGKGDAPRPVVPICSAIEALEQIRHNRQQIMSGIAQMLTDGKELG